VLGRDECRSIVRQLWPYLDGALPGVLQDRITEHLAWCTRCRSHFEFASSFLDAIHRHAGAGHAVDMDGLRIRVLRALATMSDGGP
jgi:predicted anti-sigma-YlaC factor YlaD